MQISLERSARQHSAVPRRLCPLINPGRADPASSSNSAFDRILRRMNSDRERAPAWPPGTGGLVRPAPGRQACLLVGRHVAAVPRGPPQDCWRDVVSGCGGVSGGVAGVLRDGVAASERGAAAGGGRGDGGGDRVGAAGPRWRRRRGWAATRWPRASGRSPRGSSRRIGCGRRGRATSRRSTSSLACSKRSMSWSGPRPAGIPSRRCGGRSRRPTSWPDSSPRRATGCRRSWCAGCCIRWATRCRRPPRQVEGASHPDRNAQFEYLNANVADRLAASEPVISVDTKKKELIGNYANGGKDWRPAGEPERVNVHDFADRALGEHAKAIPYGIYDIGNDEGWVSVGDVADTAEFAVESIRRWWNTTGHDRFPERDHAHDHRRCRRLQRLPGPGLEVAPRPLAAETGLAITVLHYPPGTSQVEQDRAPPVQLHLDELARPAPHQHPHHHRAHRRHHHPDRPQRQRQLRPELVRDRRRRSPTPRCAPYPSTPTTGTATGTTPSPQPETRHQSRGEP